MNINESMNQRQWISIVGFEQVNFSFGIIVRIPPLWDFSKMAVMATGMVNF